MKFDKSKAIFLLGGHDLEMQTIKEVLIDNGFKEGEGLFDKELQWDTAKLSTYNDEIAKNKGKIIYAVELDEDIELPINYHRIDHHNDYADKDASLLQILALLGNKVTREQKLIAANDARYISGMKCLDALAEEIIGIRQEDRKIQGISKREDEIAKEIVLDESKRKVIADITIINADKVPFSAISDSLYFENKQTEKTIIYDDTKIVFYGFSIESIKEILKKHKISSKKYYYGGGSAGFVGLKKQSIDKGTINKLRVAVVEDNKTDIYSYHTFMLPFRFDKILENFTSTYEYYQENDLEDRIKITSDMKESLEKDGWEHQSFKIQNQFDYNEYAYFYSFIRETLYNKNDFKENDTSYFFEKEYKGGQYNIKIKDKTYELELEGLSLRIFETGIAIFSIEVSNRKYSQSDMNDILKINEYARRIYAPFLGRSSQAESWTQAAKSSQLASSVEVILPDGTVCKDNFCDDYIKIPDEIKISPYILELLGQNTFTILSTHDKKYYIQPIIDDRMFVLSWYGSDICSERMREHQYVDSDKWYEYVFVDGTGITVHNKEMQESLIKKATYNRWMDYKYGVTLFGLTRYSFVCLSNASDFSKAVLPLPHMKTMYFQMFTLILAIRASTLRFSEEVTALSSIKNEKDNHFSEKVSTLYRYYIKFVNKIYFREITAQEQGIELYNQALDCMHIQRDVKDLDAEIAELHTYVSLKSEEKQARQADERENRLEIISKLGAIFLPPSLIAGIYGMNVFDFQQSYGSFVMVLILMFLSAIGSYIFISKKNNNDKSSEKKSEEKDLYKIASILLVLMFIIAVSVKINGEKKNMVQDVRVNNQIECSMLETIVKSKKGEKNENNKTKGGT